MEFLVVGYEVAVGVVGDRFLELGVDDLGVEPIGTLNPKNFLICGLWASSTRAFLLLLPWRRPNLILLARAAAIPCLVLIT